MKNKENKDFGDSVSQDEFHAHCKSNEETDKKLEKLLPLAKLIPVLESIVKEKESMTFISKRILRIVTYIATIIGLILGLLELWKRIK